jgi:hypothetical protein
MNRRDKARRLANMLSEWMIERTALPTSPKAKEMVAELLGKIRIEWRQQERQDRNG